MSRRWTDQPNITLRCSFCQKNQDEVAQLISSPSRDYRRAWICGECIAVCASILSGDADPLGNPLLEQVLNAAKEWTERESQGMDAAAQLAEVRRIALLLFATSN